MIAHALVHGGLPHIAETIINISSSRFHDKDSVPVDLIFQRKGKRIEHLVVVRHRKWHLVVLGISFGIHECDEVVRVGKHNAIRGFSDSLLAEAQLAHNKLHKIVHRQFRVTQAVLLHIHPPPLYCCGQIEILGNVVHQGSLALRGRTHHQYIPSEIRMERGGNMRPITQGVASNVGTLQGLLFRY